MHPIPFAVINMDRVEPLAHYLSRGINVALVPFLLLLIGFLAVAASAEPSAGNAGHPAGNPPKQVSIPSPAFWPLTMDHSLAAHLLAQSEYPTLDEEAFGDDREAKKKPQLWNRLPV